MTDEQATTSSKIDERSLQILRGLYSTLETRAPDKEAWNLNQIARAKQTVIARYAPVFSLPNVARLDEKEFLGFLRSENNLHWSGLEKNGSQVTKDMSTLRQALTLLVDETVPIKTRLARIRPQTGPPMVKWLGRAVLTAILQVEYPERYGVLNNVAEKALQDLALWPQGTKNASEAEVYEVVNHLLLRLASELATDLWTLDYLWWYLGENAPTAKDDPSMKVTPAVDPSPKSASQPGPRPTTPPSSVHRPSRLALPSGLDVSNDRRKEQPMARLDPRRRRQDLRSAVRL